jgi:hypothetical protein
VVYNEAQGKNLRLPDYILVFWRVLVNQQNGVWIGNWIY